MPNFCQLSDYPMWTIYWLFWVNHFGTRKNILKVTNQQWCWKKTPIPGYKNKAIQWKGCEQESSSSWYRVGIRCLVNQIWTDQSDYQILREKKILCNSQQCTWFHVNLGIQFFFWSILLISSNFHILSRMMIILSSLFFACLWLPCKGVITNLNDALFRKLAQQFQEHVAFNLLPRKTNSSPFTPQKWCLEDKLYTFLLNWSAVFKGELLIFGVEWVL